MHYGMLLTIKNIQSIIGVETFCPPKRQYLTREDTFYLSIHLFPLPTQSVTSGHVGQLESLPAVIG